MTTTRNDLPHAVRDEEGFDGGPHRYSTHAEHLPYPPGPMPAGTCTAAPPTESAPVLAEVTDAVEAYRLVAQLLRAFEQDLEDNPEAPSALPAVAAAGASEATATRAGEDGTVG